MKVRLDKIHQGYRGRPVLDSVSLELRPGVTALLGPNGAGKSTLMRTLVTDLAPRSGQVVIGEAAITSRQERRAARRHIGYLPQTFGYDARFTVREHTEMLAWLRGVPAHRRAGEVSQAIELVDLTARCDDRLGALSGGQRQRAGIAGALVGRPELLVLDEPTVGLDPAQRASFRRLIRALPATYVLLSTHLTDDVDAVAQHLVLLHEGTIRTDESVADFRRRRGTVEAGYLAAVENREVCA